MASRAAAEFLKESLALPPEQQVVRVLRGDAGFFDQELPGFLEQRKLHDIVVVRLTRWLKHEAARIEPWRALDAHYTSRECFL